MTGKVYRAIGLMSGTSCDGVDAAYVETNGHGFVVPGEAASFAYEPAFRKRLMAVLGQPDSPALPQIKKELTELHARAVELLLLQMGKSVEEIDVIGFHGQTIFHDPQNRKTLQIGDGALLAGMTGIDAVNDFRSADVAAGGQGAPLVPLYHAAIASAFPKPCVIVNIGGVANITFLGSDKEIIACDTGPGNALIDDAMMELFGIPFDEHGGIAAMGSVNEDILNTWLADEFFTRPFPKSLDRNHFKCNVSGLMPDEAIATLTEFTARAIAAITLQLPSTPLMWIITGGGRKNHTLMQRLGALLDGPVHDITEMKFDGDQIEAQAFGYLAVRHKLDLPLSLPTTTGVPAPQCGGKFHAARTDT